MSGWLPNGDGDFWPNDPDAPHTHDEIMNHSIGSLANSCRFQLSALMECYGLSGQGEAKAIAEEVLERLMKK
jgi:hypothetical protein